MHAQLCALQVLSHTEHKQIFLLGKCRHIWGSPPCHIQGFLVMLQVPFACSSMADLFPNGVKPFWALQEEGSMLGSTGNPLGSIPDMGWETWVPWSM